MKFYAGKQKICLRSVYDTSKTSIDTSTTRRRRLRRLERLTENYKNHHDYYNNMFWFFKKKGNDAEAHKKIDKLHNSVADSFKNLKRDMDSINLWLNNFKGSEEMQNQKLENIEKHLSHILKKIEHHEQAINSHAVSIESLNPGNSEFDEAEEPEEAPESMKISKSIGKVDPRHTVSGLTDTQKLIFIRLISLQREFGGWVPLKSLAEELYPGKQYSDVRSTISEYLTLLSEWGIVTKKRTGKQSFVSVTEKGQELINHLKTDSKIESKVIIRKKVKAH